MKSGVSDQVVTVFVHPDHWYALTAGCQLMIDAQLDPAVRRIALHDARSVLGWEAVRAIETGYGAVGICGALRNATQGGVIERQPLRPLALLLSGAVSEACFYVADADDPAAAREEVGRLIVRLFEGLRRVVAAARPRWGRRIRRTRDRNPSVSLPHRGPCGSRDGYRGMCPDEALTGESPNGGPRRSATLTRTSKRTVRLVQ